MAVQVLPVVRPPGLINGKLGPCQLTPVFFPGVGQLSLYPTAARAWNVMALICKADTGIALSTTGTYRSYDAQVQLFNQRYRKVFNPLTCTTTSSRTWDGVKYYKLRTVAAAAVPGTSNHGLGIANDVAAFVDNKVVAITGTKAWQWLVDHAVEFGWSWEGATLGQAGFEAWHLRHLHGNDVSQRVKDVEAWFAAQGKP